MNLGSESGTISVILGSLFLFGLLFNWFVGWANEKGYSEGFISFFVAVGVLISVCGYWLMPGNGRDIDLLLGCFVCSGTPMILGDFARYARARKRTQERIAAQYHDEP